MYFWYLWFILILCCCIIPAANARKIRQIKQAKRNRNKRKSGGMTMNELIKSFIGKNVILYGYSTGVEGTVTKIEDNWIEVEDKKGKKQLVNIDYVSRIQEYPRSKKG